MSLEKAQSLHKNVAQVRESGNSLQALSLYPDVIHAYLEAENYSGAAEILADQFLTLRHLSENTQDEN